MYSNLKRVDADCRACSVVPSLKLPCLLKPERTGCLVTANGVRYIGNSLLHGPLYLENSTMMVLNFLSNK